MTELEIESAKHTAGPIPSLPCRVSLSFAAPRLTGARLFEAVLRGARPRCEVGFALLGREVESGRCCSSSALVGHHDNQSEELLTGLSASPEAARPPNEGNTVPERSVRGGFSATSASSEGDSMGAGEGMGSAEGLNEEVTFNTLTYLSCAAFSIQPQMARSKTCDGKDMRLSDALRNREVKIPGK